MLQQRGTRTHRIRGIIEIISLGLELFVEVGYKAELSVAFEIPLCPIFEALP